MAIGRAPVLVSAARLTEPELSIVVSARRMTASVSRTTTAALMPPMPESCEAPLPASLAIAPPMAAGMPRSSASAVELTALAESETSPPLIVAPVSTMEADRLVTLSCETRKTSRSWASMLMAPLAVVPLASRLEPRSTVVVREPMRMSPAWLPTEVSISTGFAAVPTVTFSPISVMVAPADFRLPVTAISPSLVSHSVAERLRPLSDASRLPSFVEGALPKGS